MEQTFQQKACTCIVPFYNEGRRVLQVLQILTKVKNLSAIIAVDGGSTDTAYEQVKQQFPQVKLVRMEKAEGKSEAVERGLHLVKTEYVMLFDADIYNFKPSDVEEAIRIVFTDSSVDLLILRREDEPLIFRVTRGELVLSGERILRTEDLLEVYKKHPKGYQLEIAMNTYMTNHKKHVYWMAYPGRNVLKARKVGFLQGLLDEVQMYRNVGSYIGYGKYLENLLFFCRQQYPSPKSLS